jgi:hypothetical protein
MSLRFEPCPAPQRWHLSGRRPRRRATPARESREAQPARTARRRRLRVASSTLLSSSIWASSTRRQSVGYRTEATRRSPRRGTGAVVWATTVRSRSFQTLTEHGGLHWAWNQAELPLQAKASRQWAASMFLRWAVLCRRLSALWIAHEKESSLRGLLTSHPALEPRLSPGLAALGIRVTDDRDARDLNGPKEADGAGDVCPFVVNQAGLIEALVGGQVGVWLQGQIDKRKKGVEKGRLSRRRRSHALVVEGAANVGVVEF